MTTIASVTSDVIEVLLEYSDSGNAEVFVTSDIVEVLIPVPTRSPTTVTGACVSLDAVEVLFNMNSISYNVYVSQETIEVLMLGDNPDALAGNSEPSVSGGTTGWVSL